MRSPIIKFILSMALSTVIFITAVFLFFAWVLEGNPNSDWEYL